MKDVDKRSDSYYVNKMLENKRKIEKEMKNGASKHSEVATKSVFSNPNDLADRLNLLHREKKLETVLKKNAEIITLVDRNFGSHLLTIEYHVKKTFYRKQFSSFEKDQLHVQILFTLVCFLTHTKYFIIIQSNSCETTLLCFPRFLSKLSKFI